MKFSELMKIAKSTPSDSFRLLPSSNSTTNSTGKSDGKSTRDSVGKSDGKITSTDKGHSASTHSQSQSQARSEFPSNATRLTRHDERKREKRVDKVSIVTDRIELPRPSLTQYKAPPIPKHTVVAFQKKKSKIPSDLIQVNTVKRERTTVEEALESVQSKRLRVEHALAQRPGKPFEKTLPAKVISRDSSNSSRPKVNSRDQSSSSLSKVLSRDPPLAKHANVASSSRNASNSRLADSHSSSKQSASELTRDSQSSSASKTMHNSHSNPMSSKSSNAMSTKSSNAMSSASKSKSIEPRHSKSIDPYLKSNSQSKSRNHDDHLDDPEYIKSNMSSIIGDIFNYNSRKYRDDEDDDDMEVGFDRVYKEELKRCLGFNLVLNLLNKKTCKIKNEKKLG